MTFVFKKPRRPVHTVFVHCSASDNPAHDNVATMDTWHKQRGWSGVGYHIFIRKSGEIELGRSLEKTPAAQGGNNRGTIAICLHGLVSSKFTKAQIAALQALCQQIDQAYGGQMRFRGHKEVAAKACPVIDYKSVLKLNEHGDLGVFKSRVVAKAVDLGDLSELEEADAGAGFDPILRIGSRGHAVEVLQNDLKSLGYHVGAVDGHFGKMTRAAVLAFQADNHLVEDGVVGGATHEALDDAEAREFSEQRRTKSVAALAADGSRIAQASVANGVMGTTFSIGGGLALLEENSGMVSRLTESLGTYSGVVKSLGPWVGAIVVVGGLMVLFQAIKAGRARVEDHRTGRTA